MPLYFLYDIVFCSLGCFVSGFLMGSLVEMKRCSKYQSRAIKALERIKEESSGKDQKEDVA